MDTERTYLLRHSTFSDPHKQLTNLYTFRQCRFAQFTCIIHFPLNTSVGRAFGNTPLHINCMQDSSNSIPYLNHFKPLFRISSRGTQPFIGCGTIYFSIWCTAKSRELNFAAISARCVGETLNRRNVAYNHIRCASVSQQNLISV